MDIAHTNLFSSALLILLITLPAPAPGQVREDLDVVIAGGRVMDPETRLDATRHVGIRDGRIAAISAEPLEVRLRAGGTRIDAGGLVVAPGFIDLHAHGQSPEAFDYRARDGVTTALELEWGYPRVGEWLASRSGKARIHYGASVSHGALRALVMPDTGVPRPSEDELREMARGGEPLPLFSQMSGMAEAVHRDLPETHVADLLEQLEKGLEEGGLGFGVAHQYYPGASRREIYRIFELAEAREVPIYTHVRSMSVGAMQEVIANAAATGASLHIVHVNSMSGGELPVILEMIAGARQRGVDVTTEAYPYTAASTFIQSTILDDGWQERLGITYGDLQWQDTGERLSAESFARYREQGGIVILHFMKDETIDLAMSTPWVIVASDAMPYAPGAHPRSAGTYARVLGRYVRERGVVDLMSALGKMTLLPARRLETVAAGMKRKGRLQVGADADVVVFDPITVIDTATFEAGLDSSRGIRHVLVAGTAVVRDEEIVEDAFPGRPVVGRHAMGPAEETEMGPTASLTVDWGSPFHDPPVQTCVDLPIDPGVTTALGLMELAAAHCDPPIAFTHTGADATAFLVSIGEVSHHQDENAYYWIYRVNGQSPNIGIGVYTLSHGDRVAWKYTPAVRREDPGEE